MEVVAGYLQAYDWGATDGLATWVGATGGPQAELWFGTHPNGPSPMADGSGDATTELRILAKLLAAGRPLSIQIHPAEPLAAQMFADQSPDHPGLLPDPYGKAEILIAIEPFLILEGFRDPRLSATVFEALGPDFEPARAALLDADIPTAIRFLLAHSDVTAAPRLPEAIRDAGLPDSEAMAEVVDCFPGDPGVFVAALLNSRTLQPGQGVYVDPGTVHAYVRGLGLEVMTNSDNVLRLGLTSKTIAVDEALTALDVEAQPHPLEPPPSPVRRYVPDGAPFEVAVLDDGEATAATGVARIVVCLSGTATVGSETLTAGQAALLSADEPDLSVRTAGSCVIAQQVAR